MAYEHTNTVQLVNGKTLLVFYIILYYSFDIFLLKMTNLTETKTPIKVVLGTMEFGREHRESTSSDVCQDMVEYFVADGSSTTKADRKVRSISVP